MHTWIGYLYLEAMQLIMVLKLNGVIKTKIYIYIMQCAPKPGNRVDYQMNWKMKSVAMPLEKSSSLSSTFMI